MAKNNPLHLTQRGRRVGAAAGILVAGSAALGIGSMSDARTAAAGTGLGPDAATTASTAFRLGADGKSLHASVDAASSITSALADASTSARVTTSVDMYRGKEGVQIVLTAVNSALNQEAPSTNGLYLKVGGHDVDLHPTQAPVSSTVGDAVKATQLLKAKELGLQSGDEVEFGQRFAGVDVRSRTYRLDLEGAGLKVTELDQGVETNRIAVLTDAVAVDLSTNLGH